MKNQKDPSLYTVPPQNIEAEQSMTTGDVHAVRLQVLEALVEAIFKDVRHVGELHVDTNLLGPFDTIAGGTGAASAAANEGGTNMRSSTRGGPERQ